jgi:hypothetical protein
MEVAKVDKTLRPAVKIEYSWISDYLAKRKIIQSA